MAKDDKIKKAAALRYDASRNAAPVLVAGGRGAVAEKILELGKEAGVPVVEDPDLAEMLGAFPVGKEIPPELYRAVAEVLAFVYRAGKRFRGLGG
ncbi:MAG: EscU/YscU/HrcU family type III secretion system export apparatus switch protein [Deltaproteobacteria bacterium]|nr:EscU/YscU/HrcU family type III secretion system export apparatus switch protein [Deltaproteobacteria bacterium]